MERSGQNVGEEINKTERRSRWRFLFIPWLVRLAVSFGSRSSAGEILRHGRPVESDFVQDSERWELANGARQVRRLVGRKTRKAVGTEESGLCFKFSGVRGR